MNNWFSSGNQPQFQKYEASYELTTHSLSYRRKRQNSRFFASVLTRFFLSHFDPGELR